MSPTQNPDWAALYDVTIVGGGPAGFETSLSPALRSTGRRLSLELDPSGLVRVDARQETFYAAGDLTTMMQNVTTAAAMVNHDLAFGPPATVRHG
mgnify:CR=1 FL=1